MIPLRLSKLIVMSGPPLILYLLSHYHINIYVYLEGEEFSSQNYSEVWLYEEGLPQRLATFLIYIHFAKILLEVLFVHRMSGRNIPVNRTLWQILFYWGFLGCLVGYSLFHPLYQPLVLKLDDYEFLV